MSGGGCVALSCCGVSCVGSGLSFYIGRSVALVCVIKSVVIGFSCRNSGILRICSCRGGGSLIRSGVLNIISPYRCGGR